MGRVNGGKASNVEWRSRLYRVRVMHAKSSIKEPINRGRSNRSVFDMRLLTFSLADRVAVVV